MISNDYVNSFQRVYNDVDNIFISFIRCYAEFLQILIPSHYIFNKLSIDCFKILCVSYNISSLHISYRAPTLIANREYKI